mgnify:CR=1 FL=1
MDDWKEKPFGIVAVDIPVTALTSTLTAQLAIKFDLKIVPVFIERNSNNNFRIEFLNQIKASDFKNKILSSKSEARRLIFSNGLKINDVTVKDEKKLKGN